MPTDFAFQQQIAESISQQIDEILAEEFMGGYMSDSPMPMFCEVLEPAPEQVGYDEDMPGQTIEDAWAALDVIKQKKSLID